MTWVNTNIKRSDLAENKMSGCQIDGRSLIVTLVKDHLSAFSARCPHAAGDLAAGTLYRGRVDCPVHGWRFDVLSGRTLYPADEAVRLKRYPVKVKDGSVWIEI